MSTYLTILSAALPVFIVFGTGFLARSRGWLTTEADGSVMKLIINALYPCLILSFILGNEALKNPEIIISSIAGGYLCAVVGITLGYFLAPLGGMHVGTGRRTFAFSSGLNNYGYVAIPVAAAVFGLDSPMMGVLLVYNVGVEAGLWTFGLLILSGKFSRDSWKNLLSPPLLGMVLGLILNFAGLPDAKGMVGVGYDICLSAVQMMGACTVPLGLIVSGAILCDLVRSGEWLGRWQVPVLGLLSRNGIQPALYIAAAMFLPMSIELKQVLAVQAAMPAAMFPIVLSRFYGGSPAVAVQIVVASTLAGLATIPLWLAFGLKLLG